MGTDAVNSPSHRHMQQSEVTDLLTRQRQHATRQTVGNSRQCWEADRESAQALMTDGREMIMGRVSRPARLKATLPPMLQQAKEPQGRQVTAEETEQVELGRLRLSCTYRSCPLGIEVDWDAWQAWPEHERVNLPMHMCMCLKHIQHTHALLYVTVCGDHMAGICTSICT